MLKNTALRYRIQNRLHSMLLLGGMLLILSLIGYLVAGYIGIIWALVVGILLMLGITRLSPRLVLFLYRAQPIPRQSFIELHEILAWLSSEARLPVVPALYYIPSRMMLAFSVGLDNNASIGISDAVLRQLNMRELAGVLAHEVSHIRGHDLWVLSLADVLSRLTSLMALAGYFMLIVYLPLYLIQDTSMPWLLLIVLIIAPNLSALMQLALSRTREFNADYQAVRLTGDPEGLISALRKIGNYEKTWIESLLLPGTRVPVPSLLRTHPYTHQRIERLEQLKQKSRHPFDNMDSVIGSHPTPNDTPRRRISGIWH